MENSLKIILKQNIKTLFIITLIIANISLIKNAEQENEVLTTEEQKRNSIITGCTNLIYSRLNYDPVKNLKKNSIYSKQLIFKLIFHYFSIL